MNRPLEDQLLGEFTDWVRKRSQSADALRRAAQEMRQEYQAGLAQFGSPPGALGAGGYEQRLTYLAAADGNLSGRLPPMRISEGPFKGISLTWSYRLRAADGDPPVSVLVQLPEDLLESYAGRQATLAVSEQSIALGAFDAQGRLLARLPPDLQPIREITLAIGAQPPVQPPDNDPAAQE